MPGERSPEMVVVDATIQAPHHFHLWNFQVLCGDSSPAYKRGLVGYMESLNGEVGYNLIRIVSLWVSVSICLHAVSIHTIDSPIVWKYGCSRVVRVDLSHCQCVDNTPRTVPRVTFASSIIGFPRVLLLGDTLRDELVWQSFSSTCCRGMPSAEASAVHEICVWMSA